MSTSDTPVTESPITESAHLIPSVPESVSFADAMLSNPVLLETLRAQEILHLKLVCKSWAKCYADIGTRTIVTVRRQDDRRDWYFPILVNYQTQQITPRWNSWSWSGISHECADHASQRVHFLPPLANLPREWTGSTNPRYNGIVAGAGGLVLIKTMPGVICSSGLNSQPANWESLLVWNPLTKELRELPAAETVTSLSSRNYRGVQAHMAVDDKANSYQVILTFRALVCVYDSTSNCWNTLRFPESGPWGRHPASDCAWAHVCGSVYSRGRLHFADIEVGPVLNYAHRHFTFQLRVFEIDFDTGKWTSLNRDIPPLIQNHDFMHCPLHDIQVLGGITIDMGRVILPFLELVDCMGEIYAVVPASLDRFLKMGVVALQQMRPQKYELLRHHFNDEFEYMPLQFYIFQLNGASLVHGALRIELPRSTSDIWARRESLSQTRLNIRPPFQQWFSCTASGRVIWVSFEDYLLQYDVVSGQSRTQIIPVNGSVDRLRFSYRPSFHLKP